MFFHYAQHLLHCKQRKNTKILMQWKFMMEISKFLMVQIQILTFKICGRIKGFCNWMDVVKVMKGF